MKSDVFPESVFERLPDLFENLFDSLTRREQDIVLLSSLGVLSNILPDVYCFYRRKKLYTNLFVMIVAPPASGKGEMSLALELARDINTYLKSYSTSIRNKCLENKKKKSTQCPSLRFKIIPGNISAARMYQLNNDGTLENLGEENLHEIFENYTLINAILMELDLEWAQIQQEYIMVGELSQGTSETLIVIPEIAEAYEDVLNLNTHLVLVNRIQDSITHTYYESYTTNGWRSDAIAIEDIRLDPLVYRIENAKKAFGIRIHYRNGSQLNPYQEEVLSLYTKDGNRIKKVLNNFTIHKSIGEVNVNSCYASYEKTQNNLSLDTSKINGYYNLLVENITSTFVYEEDDNGDCQPRVTNQKIQQKLLSYDGGQYQEAGIPDKGKVTKTLNYSEIIPKKLNAIQIPNFYVENAYQINNTKIIFGYYDPKVAEAASKDTENDWGERLLQLDNSNGILYTSMGVGDPYLFEPHFYTSNSSNKTIIICQLAFEYPFGGEVYVLKNETIRYIGNLDIESTQEDTYLTDIVVIKETDQRIEFSFKSDSLVLEPGDKDIVIPNNNVRYLFENNTLFLRK